MDTGRSVALNNSPLKNPDSCATLEPSIVVRRRDLELEHSNLIERIQHLRRLLGYPPLLTGKQQRHGTP